MSRTRPPAVAGLFYPSDPAELRNLIDDLLRGARPGASAASRPSALVVPHAGLIYSGPVAASAYRLLRDSGAAYRRVALFGPAHRVPIRGLALPGSAVFLTPLGEVPVDTEAVAELARIPPEEARVEISDLAHAQEHSLEVQLPFLQRVLGDFRLLPLVVGDAGYTEVEAVMERLWGEDTLLLVSSDLSHYYDYATAQSMDRSTSTAIEHLAPDAIGYEDACGRIPLGGLLLSARRHGLHATTLDLRNSGDTAGPRDQVVGYGAYALGP